MRSAGGGAPPGVPSSRRGGRLLLVGAAAWLVQPLYVVAEVVAAAASTAPYSVLDQTISDLGATTCTEVEYPYGPVEVCSPAHLFVDGGLVLSGVLLAVGAVLLARTVLPRRRSTTAATVAWGVAGASAVATGLVPVDRDLVLHSVVALPALVAQPVALLLLGASLRGWSARLALPTVLVGVVSVVGAVAFLVTATEPALTGFWERLGFWPTYLWLPVVAAALLARARRTVGDRGHPSSAGGGSPA